MTATSPPPISIEWEPQVEGIVLFLTPATHTEPKVLRLPMQSVQELRDDMTEAAMLSRGLDKVECFFMEIEPNDFLILMGDAYKVTNMSEGRDGWVCEFQLNTYSPDASEITFPPDQLVTVWRPIE